MNSILQSKYPAVFLRGLEPGFAVGLLLLLALTVLIYWPGLSGPLVLDDTSNLSPLGDNGGVNSWGNVLRWVFGNTSGPTGRPVSMLSFLIDTQKWTSNTAALNHIVAALKYTNVLVHALTGTVVCWLSYALFQAFGANQVRSAWLALLVTALWLLHPLNASTTLYVVQRMTQLMTLFGLAALLCYVKGRLALATNVSLGTLLLGIALFPFALLSVLSKENGALLLVLIVVIESTVFASAAKSRIFSLWYRGAVLLPLAIIFLYLLYTMNGNLELYPYRHFDLTERLLTESRILCLYLAKIFLPFTRGVSLYHDDYVLSTGLFQPFTTLTSIVALLGLLVSAVRLRKSQPMLFFGVAWFFSMHLLESTYIPLELYFEHRNYMAMIGPIIAAVWYFHLFLSNADFKELKRVLLVGVVCLLVIMTTLTWQSARLWGDSVQLISHWAFDKPGSSRAQIGYANFLAFNGDPQGALDKLQQAQSIHPDEITILMQSWNTACEHGLEPPLSLEEIAKRQRLENFYNDINAQLKILLQKHITQVCGQTSNEDVLQLFQAIDQLKMPERRKAAFHFLYSDLFVHMRILDSALIQLSKTFQLFPDPEIPIRQAIISASAGNYADSLVFLERARLANEERSLLKPSFESQISDMQLDMNRRLNSNQ